MDNISLGQLFGATIVFSGIFSLACSIGTFGKKFIPSIYKLDDKKRNTYRVLYGLSGVICTVFGMVLLLHPELMGN